MENKKEIQSVLLECDCGGDFTMKDSTKSGAIHFHTPDGEGVKLKLLLNKLQNGDRVRICFCDRISAPTDKEVADYWAEWEKQFQTNNDNKTEGKQ